MLTHQCGRCGQTVPVEGTHACRAPGTAENLEEFRRNLVEESKKQAPKHGGIPCPYCGQLWWKKPENPEGFCLRTPCVEKRLFDMGSAKAKENAAFLQAAVDTAIKENRHVAYPDDNPKTQYGLTKPPMWVIPSAALIELGLAMQLGAKKYGAYNWRDKTVSASIYVDAAERHLRAWLDGEDRERESGASHLGHVMACCAILIDAHATGKLNDNRPKGGVFAELVRQFEGAVRNGQVPAMKPKEDK
jgi:hypothetical protein